MVREAEAHAAEDQQRREEIELKNQADNLAYQAEKLLRETGDRLPGEKLESEDQGRVAAVRSAMQSSDTAGIRRAMEDLERTLQQLARPPTAARASAAGGRLAAAPHRAPSRASSARSKPSGADSPAPFPPRSARGALNDERAPFRPISGRIRPLPPPPAEAQDRGRGIRHAWSHPDGLSCHSPRITITAIKIRRAAERA